MWGRIKNVHAGSVLIENQNECFKGYYQSQKRYYGIHNYLLVNMPFKYRTYLIHSCFSEVSLGVYFSTCYLKVTHLL